MALSEPYSTDKEPTFRTLFAFGYSLAVDRSHERLVVVLTRGDAFGCDFVYAPEVLLSERYVYSGGVLLQVLAAFSTGNRDDILTLVQKPRQCALTRHEALLGGDLLDSKTTLDGESPTTSPRAAEGSALGGDDYALPSEWRDPIYPTAWKSLPRHFGRVRSTLSPVS
jgi:hypothetical protein